MAEKCRLCDAQPPLRTIHACPGCNEVWWCELCEERAEDWHILWCSNPIRPLTTAHRLTLACLFEVWPEDPQTKEDFFLDRVRGPKEKLEMTSFYKDFIIGHAVAPSTLQKWRLEGCLIENIKNTFETLPSLRATTKEESYRWFLQHQDLFQPAATPDEALSKRHVNHYCVGCEKRALHCCSGCNKAWYCSKECQKKEWPIHIVDCNPRRPLTPADHLGAALHRNLLPEDPEIFACFGFSALSIEDQQHLARCYEIVFHSGIKAKQLEQWRLEGKLGEEMISILHHGGQSEHSETARLLGWLRSHIDIFNPDAPKRGPNGYDYYDESLVDAWKRIGDHSASTVEDIQRSLDLWSKEKYECFSVYHQHIAQFGPLGADPALTTYLSFGYCICHEEDLTFLHACYKILIDSCPFEELLAAYESSNLINLLDKYGIRQRHFLSPYLEDVLSGSPHVYKSVWRLKQFIVASGSTRYQVPLAVSVDYGFSNCRSEEEYSDLKVVYSELLRRRETNPLALHDACIRGQLFEHVSRMYPRIKKSKVRGKYQRLLRNPHPFPSGNGVLRISSNGLHH